jgi:hypothetical protein
MLSRGSSVGKTITMRVEQQKILASITDRGKIILSPGNYRNRLYGLPILLLVRKWGRYAMGQSFWDVKLTTQSKSENNCRYTSACLVNRHDADSTTLDITNLLSSPKEPSSQICVPL